MSDWVDEEFRGYYPGSKKTLPVGEAQPAQPDENVDSWDARPTKKIVNGKEVEFFTIGAVAKALSKSVVTVRHDIRQGHLPQATFRLPDKTTNGRVTKGRRLYTRPQIEAVIAVAKAHGILGEKRIDWTKHTTFAADVRKAWSALPPL